MDTSTERIRRELREFDLAQSKCPVDQRQREKEAEEEARKAREAQEQQQARNRQEARERQADKARTMTQTDNELLPDALRDALGQIISEERRQWKRERELIQSEALATIADLRAQIAELLGEIRQKSMELKAGAPGPPGQPGERGPTGPPGQLPLAQSWGPGRVFYSGDVVVHAGSTYQCLRDSGRSVHSDDFICLAKAGRDGRDGVTPVVRGTYNVHETYSQLDIVVCDGASFVAKFDNPGILPGDGWQLMSRQGRPGRKGDVGERGLTGQKGDRGPHGEVVPQIVSFKLN